MRGYGEHDLAGLVRKPRSNRGQHQLPQELQHLIEGLALRRPRLSAAAVCRQAVEVANVQNWPAPSYSTVFTIVRGLAPDLVTLAHQGTKVYADRFELLYGVRQVGPTRCGKPITHHWICGYSTNGVGLPDLG